MSHENSRNKVRKGAEAVASIIEDQHADADTNKIKAIVAKVGAALDAPQPKRKIKSCHEKDPTVFKSCCSPDSSLGKTSEVMGAKHFRLIQENSDMSRPKEAESLKKLVQQLPGCVLWGSTPCGPWSQWQQMALHHYGAKYKEKLNSKQQTSLEKIFLQLPRECLIKGAMFALNGKRAAKAGPYQY